MMRASLLQRRALLRGLLAGAAASGLGAIGPRPARAAACIANAQRVVSVGGAVTEIVAALDALCRVIATDTTSLYPQAVAALPRVGYMRALAAEGIVALGPTLVLASDRSGPETSLRQIRESGVDIRLIPDAPRIEAIAGKIEAIGAALALEAPAKALAAAVSDDLAVLRAAVAALPRRPKVLFLLSVARSQPMAGGTDTAADAMIRLVGGDNAASSLSGFKPLSAESAVAAAPDAVLMMSQSVEAAGGRAAVLGLPALAGSPAARADRLIALEGTYLLGLGPRVAHAGRDLAAALHPAARLPPLPARRWTVTG